LWPRYTSRYIFTENSIEIFSIYRALVCSTSLAPARDTVPYCVLTCLARGRVRPAYLCWSRGLRARVCVRLGLVSANSVTFLWSAECRWCHGRETAAQVRCYRGGICRTGCSTNALELGLVWSLRLQRQLHTQLHRSKRVNSKWLWLLRVVYSSCHSPDHYTNH
jgi:hypothetical protein